MHIASGPFEQASAVDFVRIEYLTHDELEESRDAKAEEARGRLSVARCTRQTMPRTNSSQHIALQHCQKNLTLKKSAQELLQFLHISAALDQQRGIFETSADSWERAR